MRRLSLAFAAAAAALTLAAFTHSETQYTIDFPEGWDVTPADAQNLVTAKPKDAASGSNCNAQFVDRPQLSFTQDQINEQFSQPLTREGWASFIAMNPTEIEVSEAEAIDIGGKYLQIATIHFTAESTPVAARMGFVAMTGKIINAGCYTKAGNFEAEKALFDATVKSLKPL